MMKNWILALLASASFISCKKDSIDSVSTICDAKLIVDSNLFNDAPDDDFTFNSVEIEGACITISYSYGGGCEESEVKLIDSESEGFSLPPTRFLRLSLDDNDNCEAWITQTISFELTPLNRGDSGTFLIALEGWDKSLIYQF